MKNKIIKLSAIVGAAVMTSPVFAAEGAADMGSMLKGLTDSISATDILLAIGAVGSVSIAIRFGERGLQKVRKLVSGA